jgi:16S rRNA (adenine1518-N6/adenine1519-N6)-dimethyltransferase
LALELDTEIIPELEKNIKSELEKSSSVNFEIKNIDVLKYNPEFEKYNILANIPYYITSPILTHFLYNVENKPEQMAILMQKDV